MDQRQCAHCHELFIPTKRDSHQRRQLRKFCSMECSQLSRRHISTIEEHGQDIAIIASNTGERYWFDANMRSVLEGYGWHTSENGYLVRSSGKRTREIAHRVVIGNPPRGFFVDHIDRDKRNNRRNNLRFVTMSQNYGNSLLNNRNSSGYKGVSYDKQSHRWDARVQYHKRSYRLGLFDTPLEAAHAYDLAARQVFGEYAATNEALGLLVTSNER